MSRLDVTTPQQFLVLERFLTRYRHVWPSALLLSPAGKTVHFGPYRPQILPLNQAPNPNLPAVRMCNGERLCSFQLLADSRCESIRGLSQGFGASSQERKDHGSNRQRRPSSKNGADGTRVEVMSHGICVHLHYNMRNKNENKSTS